MNLNFVRHRTVAQSDDIYSSGTDVLVYGDVEGYCHWIELLKASADGAPAHGLIKKCSGLIP